MRILAASCLLLTLALMLLSAYLRLAHSGLGCIDWPDCYGRIGDLAPAALPRLTDPTELTVGWATPAHRLVAGVLGLLIFLLAVSAWDSRAQTTRGQRVASGLALVLTVFLAVLGLRSGGLHSPAITLGNLLGGFVLLAVLGRLTFGFSEHSSRLARWPAVVLLLVAIQVVTGALTSAHFAATACTAFPDCDGGYFARAEIVAAMDLGSHTIDSEGRAVGGPERVAIQRAHRMGAVIVILGMLALSAFAWRRHRKLSWVAITLTVLVLLQGVLAFAALALELPVGLLLSHNAAAAFLVLGLIWIGLQSSLRHD